MPRVKLSLPHERRKMALRSAEMKHKVAIAEHKVRLDNVKQELAAMRPTKKPTEQL